MSGVMANMETREASPAQLLVKIESFSLLSKCGIDKYETRGFASRNYKWKIQLYPDGIGDGIGLSIFLQHVASVDNDTTPGEKVKASFTVTVKNQLVSDKHHKETLSHWFSSSGTCLGWGWHKFLSLAEMNDPNSGFLVNDGFLLELEMSVEAVTQWSST